MNRVVLISVFLLFIVPSYVTKAQLPADLLLEVISARREKVIQKIKEIRTLENLFLAAKGHYCSTFDSLIHFAKYEELPIVELTFNKKDTLGINPVRDTLGYEPVYYHLSFDEEPSNVNDIMFYIDNLATIPYSDFRNANPETFILKAGIVDKGSYSVNVIEVFAPNRCFLKGIDFQSLGFDGNDGIRFGSLADPSTDGNWQ